VLGGRDLAKTLHVLISGRNESSARGNCHKCRVRMEKQVLSLEFQGLG